VVSVIDGPRSQPQQGARGAPQLGPARKRWVSESEEYAKRRRCGTRCRA